jgi:ATP-binding cassette, subfamily C, bacterial CydD
MLGSAATITISWSIAYFISQIFIEHASLGSVAFCLNWLALGGAAKAFVVWLQEFYATRAATAVQYELRQKLFDSINHLGPGWLANKSVAEINLLATSGLDALGPYFSKYLPQLVYTAMVTPIFVVIIFLTDLASGLTLLITLPLIPVFMILIGWATRSVQQRQLQSLTSLSQHFLEVLRGLATLKIFGRVDAQVETLNKVSKEHRERTMTVLRITFLSGFALELISSLAVALIAVSIGLRLLSGDLTLLVGLFVLLLAPEAFLPLRQVGAQFHASAEGVAASSGILDIIDDASSVRESQLDSMKTFDLTSFEFGAITVITGPSGVGKSSIFMEVLGLAEGSSVADLSEISWMPQTAKLFSGSVSANIAGVNVVPDREKLLQACNLAALDDLAIDYVVGVGGVGVSGGQAQRICLARAFYRALDKETKYILLDEPISALDDERAKVVVDSCRTFASMGSAVVAISHQAILAEAADALIAMTDV